MKHEHLWEHVNVPHALLFVGSRNQSLDVVKTFATGFLCQQPQKGHACGTCKSCLLLAAQTHPDFLILHAEGKSETIGIDMIRSIMNFCEQTPQCADKKIIIIENAHHMNISACNALLKTLEEPSGNTYFLLTTNTPVALPATIRSRCQMIRLPYQNEPVPDWQTALHMDCEALMRGTLDPLLAAQRWQKEDLLILLAQIEIYFAKITEFASLDRINLMRKIVLQHGSINPLLQLESLFIDLRRN